jgi:hypothetical protein
MPVAKTYAHMEIQGEPFSENKRMYVNVLAPKGIKKVRWYSDAEYARMYPNEVKDEPEFNAYRAFGFNDSDYITLYKGRNVEEWAENDRHNIWNNLIFNYYTPGRLELPNLTDGIEAVQLKWEQVAAKGNTMKSTEEVQKIVQSLIGMVSNSEYQGEEGTWIQKKVVVREKKSRDSRYGEKHTYVLVDAENNTYVWETNTKDYAINVAVSLKMKVKEHKEINGEKVTVVWYCKEV